MAKQMTPKNLGFEKRCPCHEEWVQHEKTDWKTVQGLSCPVRSHVVGRTMRSSHNRRREPMGI